jgi:non-ribosomal peptide synthetase component E (peptide arylation enzyme)
MPSLHPAWRIIGLFLALVFLGMAAGGVVRSRLDDPETGLLERAGNPLAFWLSAIALPDTPLAHRP